jgi:hypothetical protein
LKKKQRAPLISGRPEWIALEIFTLFVSTVVYTVIIWQDVSASAQTTLEAFKATVKEVVPFSQFALIYIIGAFELGGEIMIRFTSKIERAVAVATEEALKKGVEEGIKQGREEALKEGRVEIYRAWADWNKRREEAVAKGIPFDEPPPPNPENGIEK